MNPTDSVGPDERRTSANIFSSARSFALPLGRHVHPERPRGYYVDLSVKASNPRWPPASFRDDDDQVYVEVAQWGLGAFERYVNKEGSEWLSAARDCAEYLVSKQAPSGPLAGSWFYRHPCPHTYPLDPPWVSGMAQGEGASLLVRVGLETGESRFIAAARLALGPLRVDVASGGARGTLGRGWLPQEYPTSSPAHVLNGAIFGLWGCADVALAAKDEMAGQMWNEGRACLAENIGRWDTGHWSRYDLYPHPIANVASSFYHQLHITQLEALEKSSPREEFRSARLRFEGYRERRLAGMRAFAEKVLFRLVVPRNRLLARRLPWTR